MDKEKIKTLATILGISPEKLTAALFGVVEGGGNEEEGKIGGMDNFYFNPNVFMKLHSIDYKGLRALVVPNLKRLRR
jgi:hypothetical protein